MQHTNNGELYRIFGIFCRVWRAGGQATLTTSTEAGRVKTNLEIQLGPPDDPCPDALPVHLRQRGHRAEAPRPHQHRRRHRGPGARARNNQRAAKFQALKKSDQSVSGDVSTPQALATGTAPVPQKTEPRASGDVSTPKALISGAAPAPRIPIPPPLPSTASNRLIRVITKQSCNQLSFHQLDGGGDQEVSDEGEAAAASPTAEVDTALHPVQVGPDIRSENLHREDEVPEPMYAERHPRPLQRARERKAARTGLPWTAGFDR